MGWTPFPKGTCGVVAASTLSTATRLTADQRVMGPRMRRLPFKRTDRRGPLAAVAITCFLAGVGLLGCAPASERSVAVEGGAASNAEENRNFTLNNGHDEERGDLVLNGDSTVDGDTEPAFDAMTTEFDASHPGILSFGGAAPAAPDQDGMRWVLLTHEPTVEQRTLLATYPGPLHVYFGDAPSPEEMRRFATDLRQSLLDGTYDLEYQGYGFNDDHNGLEVLFSAPAHLTVSELRTQASSAVAATVKMTRPNFELDFIEVDGPAITDG
jgi:hypothetical protein